MTNLPDCLLPKAMTALSKDEHLEMCLWLLDTSLVYQESCLLVMTETQGKHLFEIAQIGFEKRLENMAPNMAHNIQTIQNIWMSKLIKKLENNPQVALHIPHNGTAQLKDHIETGLKHKTKKAEL